MTGEELEDALKTLGWPKIELANRMGVHPGTVTDWCQNGPTGPVIAFIQLMLTLKSFGDQIAEILEPSR